MNQEAKRDAGKLELRLVPMQIVKDIAQVRAYGNQKYGDPDNWKTVELHRYIDAMLRHTLAFVEDPHGVDAESGIPHYKHAECNWAFISEMMRDNKKDTAIPHAELIQLVGRKVWTLFGNHLNESVIKRAEVYNDDDGVILIDERDHYIYAEDFGDDVFRTEAEAIAAIEAAEREEMEAGK